MKRGKKTWEEHKAAFIHIPKTGGTYISRGCVGPGPVVRPFHYLAHTIVDDIDLPDLNWTNTQPTAGFSHGKMPVFACVRNPFSLLVSYYEMKCRANQAKASRDVNVELDREGMVGFRECLEILAQRKERTFARYGKTFMFCQLFKTSGTLAVQYICRQETLTNDVQEFAKYFDFEYFVGGPSNEGGYWKNYHDYYTSVDADFVREHWSRELQMFGYSLEGESEKPMIGRLVTEDDVAAWRYDFVTDALTHHGVEL